LQRTLRTRRLPAHGARFGEVTVRTGFEDPERGLVRCDAAPLLAAELAAHRVPSQVRQPVDGPGTPNGVLLAVSYTDRRGVAAGFAVAVHRDDAAGIIAAEEATDRWRGLLRSRRLLVADVPALCWGGHRAIRIIRQRRPDVSLGLQTGDPDGLPVVGDLVPDRGSVLLPSHGATLAARAELAARGIPVVDATCPLVATAQADAMARAADSDLVVVIGDPAHAAARVLLSYAGDAAALAGTPEDVAALTAPSGNVSFVIEPGLSAERAMPVLRALRARFPRLHGHHFDALCDAVSDREQTIVSVALASELTLVLAADPGEARRLADLAAAPVQVIARLEDLNPSVLNDVTSIGLVTGLSADQVLARELTTAISGLGPLSVRRRAARTRGYPARVPTSAR
jgi:4-hydroxy-3-methylbut-2-enyl diphosphate reductase